MLDDLKSFGDFLAKFALFLGVTATLAYMFFSIHYVPAGLTLGDSIFFFAVALAFGLAYAVLVLIGWLLVRLLASAWRGGCMGRCLVTGILVFLALGVFAVFVWLSELILLATAFCAFTMAGFFFTCLSTGWSQGAAVKLRSFTRC
ncbi:hypothetical protein [Duganella sp. P38]|uniref:hypothetical protein n=1 Tax=Duganella sp. P38 TaxID=3423949 RepID=UPI003D7C01E2